MELPSLLGETNAIRALNEEITYASRCDAKVLITGESGVGKEVVARLIHANSARRRAPLITVNCAALSDTLLETELFGHVRGSFTGAYRDRQGALELAHRGTVFMDEVGETSPRMQGLLLRFLEAGEIQRVGSDAIQSRVDVRVIAATNRQLVDSVAAKTFREDLYYRLNVIHIRVPSLRERRDDIPTFFEFFLDQFSRQYAVNKPNVSLATLSLLSEYAWPGNVRELKNIVERLVVRSSENPIEPRDLPLEVLRGTSAEQQPQAPAATPTVTSAPARSAADALFERMVNGGESFWSAVYAPFMSRDLTRDDVRAIVRRGLERTGGNYRVMVELFNMPIDDYKRFLGVLRKYQCHMPFQQFRSVTGTRTSREQAGEATQPIA
ncbi:MAG TPA: sigma-54 dependent transcriptional regulator [Vicinamibacterales bacterium]|nr:sigma-54 dependent transcriptional regulator [Vicinamibacterales bacterium]